MYNFNLQILIKNILSYIVNGRKIIKLSINNYLKENKNIYMLKDYYNQKKLSYNNMNKNNRKI